jgi:hypothetical protein
MRLWGLRRKGVDLGALLKSSYNLKSAAEGKTPGPLLSVSGLAY